MKNNNKKWLLYGFIILAILNIVLLGYIVIGLGGGNVGLSPFPWGDQCNDPNNLLSPCTIGDPVYNTQLQIRGSQIKDYINDHELKILSGSGGVNIKNIKISGIDYTTSPPREVRVDVLVNGTLSILDTLTPSNARTSIAGGAMALSSPSNRSMYITPDFIEFKDFLNNKQMFLSDNGIIFSKDNVFVARFNSNEIRLKSVDNLLGACSNNNIGSIKYGRNTGDIDSHFWACITTTSSSGTISYSWKRLDN